jgi:cell division protein FtsB
VRRTAWLLLVSVSVVGMLFLFVFPARTLVSQHHSLSATERKVAVLTDNNKRLAARVEQLHSDAEIERLARSQYGLVKPGEEAYAILPAPAPPETVAPKPKPHHKSLWDRVQFWH